MDAIWLILILIVGFWVIKNYIDVKHESEIREQRGRENNNDFRVDILEKKTYSGWIKIEKSINLHGWWGDNIILGLFGLSESFSEKIEYGQIIRVGSPSTTKSFYSSDLINIEFSKYTNNQIIHLRAKTSGDASSIRNSIAEKIAEFKRMVEVENAMRARYKAGNFNDISPYDFEKVIQELFTNMGYSVFKVGGISDGGIDLKCNNFSTNEKAIVQCKRYSGNVGIGVIRDFYGTLIHSKVDKGFVVTTSDFTKEAKEWSKGKPIVLIDGKKLSNLMMTYYK